MSIQIRQVSKSFGSFRALNDINLDIPTGELVALLGPSGSGKTTLLRLIAGLEDLDPGAGTIRYFEEDITGTPVRKRRVGFVFQHYALFRHMTVFQNIAFGLRVMPRTTRPNKTEIKARVHELLRLVQLEGLAGRFPSQLSGGQRQRVALARALAVRPRVLLLDEPFGALDAKVRAELRRWIRQLHDELHITSVFVTHDQEEALEIADRVVVMSRGRIEQVGTPTEVYHTPQTEFVMNFLGQVNMLQGSVDSGRVRLGPLELPLQNGSCSDGADAARVFVRPHDLTIDIKSNGQSSISAQVVRIHAAGPVVRVELLTVAGQTLAAELSQERFNTMKLATGDTVFVRPRHIRVFAQT